MTFVYTGPTLGPTMEALEDFDPAVVAEIAGSTQPLVCGLDTANLAFNYNNRDLTYLGFVYPGVDPDSEEITNDTGTILYTGATQPIAMGATYFPFFNGPGSPSIMTRNLDTLVVTSHPTYSDTSFVPSGVGWNRWYGNGRGTGYTNITLTDDGTGGGTGLELLGQLDAGGGGYLVNVLPLNWGVGYTSRPSIIVSGDGTDATVSDSYYHAPSDGTWTWIGNDYLVPAIHSVNGPTVVDQRTGDVWTGAESCELYQYRASENFVQCRAPALVNSSGNPTSAPELMPLCADETWMYCATNSAEESINTNNGWSIVPIDTTADEVTAAAKLPYCYWDTNPFCNDWAGVRAMIGTDGKVYILSVEDTTNFAWRLTRYDPPTLGDIRTQDPGTMMDVTADFWGTSGPNADAVSGGYAPAHFTGRNYTGAEWITLHRLPDTNSFGAVIKMPKEWTTSPTDHTKTLFGFLFADLTGISYTWHPGFVKGYMNSNWEAEDTIPVTGWAVVDCRETNNYYEQTDLILDGVDYTKRSFSFQCYPIADSAVDTSNGLMTVMVNYDISDPAVAPVVVEFHPETEWDEVYTDYATAISQPFVVNNSMMSGYNFIHPGDENFWGTSMNYPDAGIYDPGHRTWYYSGLSTIHSDGTDAAFNNLMFLNDMFVPRAEYNAAMSNPDFGPITPPILKLSLGGPAPRYDIPMALGCTYDSDVQILRRLEPTEAGAANGPALAKTRRTHQYGVLVHNTQGVSYGTAFTPGSLYPAEFKHPDQSPYSNLELYSGVHWDSLQDSYSFDSMIGWRTSRPYPTTVVAVEGFLHTSDR